MGWRTDRALRDATVAELAGWLDLPVATLHRAEEEARRGQLLRFVSGAARRELEVPVGALWAVQARLHHRLLRSAPIASAAHGGVAGRSIITHAATHLPGASELLHLDVANAYGSIVPQVVAATLRQRLRRTWREYGLDEGQRRSMADLVMRLTTTARGLPKGAPTSAGLLNLVAAGFDEAMQRLVVDKLGANGRYSRYVDDLVISSPDPLPEGVEAEVARLMRTHDLGRPNRAKTERLSRRAGDALSISGLIHTGRGFGLTPQRLGEIEATLRELAAPQAPAGSRRRARGILRFLAMVYGRGQIPPGPAAVGREILGGLS